MGGEPVSPRRAEAGRIPGDAGFSLIEVMVTMVVMSTVMVVFTASIIQAFRTSVKSESISTVQAQLQLAFQRFDRELRYASWIAPPGKVGTAWYVEYADFDGSNCGQLRLETAPAGQNGSDAARGVLEWLTWPRATPPVAGTKGQRLAANLVTPDAAGPFERDIPAETAATATYSPDFQRLRVRVSARVADSIAQVDNTFTALNTSRNTPTTNDCTKGRPT